MAGIVKTGLIAAGVGLAAIVGVLLNVAPDHLERDNAPSLDRIDASRGYVPGNVQILSYRANRIKNNASLGEIEALLIWMKRSVRHEVS